MHSKDKSNITDNYSKAQQGALVGKGNEVLTKADNLKDDKNFSNSVDTSPYEDDSHIENYGGKEYHGI